MRHPQATTEMTEIVFPEHANHYGTLFGGNALQMLAKAAFVAARQCAQANVVMAAVSGVEFLAPVPQGSVLHLRAWVSRMGRSSLTVCVHGVISRPALAEELALKGVFEMVAVDGKGRPQPMATRYINQETT
ncbi:MAG: acyl-CoA thioesterase [Brachymonas denitrificans]|uniref:acyl-CoA thioesterase n=1 Tax=Brachymonas denitrificans TaxID=28220 RepID=UPI00202171A7|nr:acyl-CoA thioesterase [Brachymonas denitrificans]